jgi:cytochrome c biogenesis protein CcdA
VLALALTAGMLAAVNPCGFALLPAYLSVLVARSSGDGPVRAVARALRGAAALTLGYVLVFGTFGLALAPVASRLLPHLPWLTVVLGAGLALTGAWLVTGRTLPVPGRPRRAPRSTVLFGMAYAIASLGCAAGPFLALVAASLRTGSVLPFLAYAGGMGLVIGVTAVAVALARVSLIARLRRVSAAVPRIGGAVLTITGGYVAYYGVYELRLAADRRVSGTDPVVNAAGDVQRTLGGVVTRAGPIWLLVLLVALIALALVIRRTNKRVDAFPSVPSAKVPSGTPVADASGSSYARSAEAAAVDGT